MTDRITDRLFQLQDLKYRDFHCGLMPTVPRENVIGVRVPALRKLAKEMKNSEEAENFISQLPHRYYDENNLHALLISQIVDYDRCVCELNRFLPFVDNWATCDIMKPVSFKKHRTELLEEISKWLSSERTYTVRFAIGMLMCYFLDESFEPKYLETVAKISSEEYYIKMMIAWYFATALAKQWDSAVLYIKENRLPVWVHNKTIQKATESYRITDEQKTYLKTLKR